MTTRRRDSTKARRICYDAHAKLDHLGRPYMECQCGRNLRPNCGQRIDPARDRWRADHYIAWAEGGEDKPDNLFPILERCDVDFKVADDIARIAKNKRIQDRHTGTRAPRSSMMGSRNHPSGLRKRMSGKVERW